MENDENTPLFIGRRISESNDQPKEYKRYWYRWYLLILFSLLSLMQSTVWNTWGPISVSAKYGLGLTDSNAFGFLVGPVMIQLPNGNSTFNSTNKDAIRTDINHYMYLHFGLALPIFIAVLIFFPNKPPTPPSSTASIPRLEIKDAIKKLIKVPSYWVIVVTNALFLGSYYGWSGVFADLYSKFNISQTESSWVGFTMTVAGIFVGSIVGLITDRVKRHMKLVVLIHIVGIFVVVLYLVVASMDWIDWPPFHFTSVTMWICCILIGVGASSFQPIVAELGAEHAFPVSEGTSSSIMMWFFMLSMFLFLTILRSVTDQRIANYLFLAFTSVSIPFFFFLVPNRHARLDIDTVN